MACIRSSRPSFSLGLHAAAAVAVCCVVLQVSVSALSQAAPDADILNLKGIFLKHVQQDQQDVAKSESLLAQAQTAHDAAAADHDVDRANVMAMAIGRAQESLDRGKKNLADDQARLDAVNQALIMWHNDPWHYSGELRALATIMRGTVTVDTPDGQVPFSRFFPLRADQHIRVGPNSFLELQLQDGSQIHIGPDSDFSYARDVQGISWQLFRGKIHKIMIIIGVRGSNDDSRYRGCTAVGAVRGTDFTLQTDGTQDTFTVLEGAIEVDPGGGRGKVTLHGGQKLVVAKSGAVGPPVTFDPQTLPHWWEH
jgi:ferric-dicitrate binding protein FerR (iron transport regulator)